MKDVIIIGAGIAGLSAAHELNKAGIDFQVIEVTNHPGGVIQTFRQGNFLLENGPNTFLSGADEILRLVDELGINDSLLQTNKDAKKRFIYLNGNLVELAFSPVKFFQSSIISKDAKYTLLEELFVKKNPEEETIEDFFLRRFGREVLTNIVQPFLAGVYAGDVRKLSVNAVFPLLKELEKKYRSVILGFLLTKMFKPKKRLSMYSFKEGLEHLPHSIYESLSDKVTFNIKDLQITRGKEFFVVTFNLNNKPITYTTNAVLFATPAYEVLNFSHLFPGENLMELFHIQYEPVAVVAQAVRKSDIKQDLNGFGYLCTREPHRKLLGTIWSSSLFPDRAPADKVLLTSYIGGEYHRKVADQTEEEIKSLATKEIAEILNIQKPDAIETLHVSLHKKAIPQYYLGHSERVKIIEDMMEQNYGLFFTGNYLYGISVNDTIKTSCLITERIKKFIKEN